MIKNESKLKACSLYHVIKTFEWLNTQSNSSVTILHSKFLIFAHVLVFPCPLVYIFVFEVWTFDRDILKANCKFFCCWNILKFGHNLINTFWYFSLIWKFCVAKSWIQKWSVESQTFHSSFLCSIFSTEFDKDYFSF